MIVRRAGGLSYRVTAMSLTLVVLLFNTRLYYPRGAEYGPDRLGADIVPGLRFVGASLRGGAGARMQDVFPEGYIWPHRHVKLNADGRFGASW